MPESHRASYVNRRNFVKGSIGAVGLASMAGCMGGGGSGGPLNFGYTASLSGSTAVLGKQYHTGFQIWRDHGGGIQFVS